MGTEQKLVVVDAYVDSGEAPDHVLTSTWDYALDQRAFGPRRLMLLAADEGGWIRALCHARRTDPPELGLEPCLLHAQRVVPDIRLAGAVALSDEPVNLPADVEIVRLRFEGAVNIARQLGIALLDWIACDDQMFMSFKTATAPEDAEPWWVVGPGVVQ